MFYGCFDYREGIIYVRPNLTPWFRECVLNHEKRHPDGYTHDFIPRNYVDCGDGTYELYPEWERYIRS